MHPKLFGTFKRQCVLNLEGALQLADVLWRVGTSDALEPWDLDIAAVYDRSRSHVDENEELEVLCVSINKQRTNAY